jgi:DNA polymerase-3 subunit epsilon
VSAELQRVTGGRLLGERLCTVRLARAFLPQLRRRSLDSLAHYYGVHIAARHRAAGDAVATAHILLRLLAEAEFRGCATLEDLQSATRPPLRRRGKRRALPHAADGDFPA